MSSPLEIVLARLDSVTKAGSGWKACCPAHADRNPSLSVSEGTDGRVLLKCFAGCAPEAIVEALGLAMRDLMPETDSYHVVGNAAGASGNGQDPKPAGNGKHPAKIHAALKEAGEAARRSAEVEARNAAEDPTISFGNPDLQWPYHNADGETVGWTLRWNFTLRDENRKVIRPLARVDGGWSVKAMDSPRPLFNLLALAGAGTVYVCEGEKACEAARRLGLVATCSAGGSGAAKQSDWSPLAGTDIVILPDNDAAGEKYAYEVARLANAAGASSIKIVWLPGLPEAGDIADWSGTTGEIINLVKSAPVWSPAVDDDGGDPVVDPQPLAEWVPFPTDLFPGPVRDFVEQGSEALQCDPAALALSVLATLASAIGGACCLHLRRTWKAWSILFGAIVADSGDRKSPPMELATAPLRKWQSERFADHAEEMREYEAQVAICERNMADWKRGKQSFGDPPEKPVEPVPSRCLAGDITLEAMAPILAANRKGVLVAVDELNSWLGGFNKYSKGGGDVGAWLSFYSAKTTTVDRKTGSPRTISIETPNVSVLGTIQPGVLRRALGVEHLENGLASRILLVAPPKRVPQWRDDDELPEDVEQAYRDLVYRLLSLELGTDDDGKPVPVVVKLSGEAKRIWAEHFNSHAQEQANMSGPLGAFWAKAEELPARFALVLHCVKGDEGPVSGTTMREAVRLADWFKQAARHAYGRLQERPEDRERRILLEWIREQPGGEATFRETQRRFPARFPASNDAEIALRAEADRGLGEIIVRRTGGRPSDVFRLNSGNDK